MLSSARRAVARVHPLASLAAAPARSFAIKSSKTTTEEVKKTEVIRNPIGDKSCLLELVHRQRLTHWADARAERPELPESPPSDIHLSVEQWPSPRYVTGMRVYRRHMARYPEPCYTVITRVRDNENTSKIWGVETFRGITEPTERRIRNTRKPEWRVLPSDMPIEEAWAKAVEQGPEGGSVLELPVSPKYAEEAAE